MLLQAAGCGPEEAPLGLYLGVLPAIPSVYNRWRVLRACLWCGPEADPSGVYPRTNNGVPPGRHRLHLWFVPVADPTGSDPRVVGDSSTSYWRTCGVVLGRTPGLHPCVTRGRLRVPIRVLPHAGFDTKLGPPSSPFDAHSTN